MRLKIQKGHTLEEYTKKYGKLLKKGRLLKIDPKNPAETGLFSVKREYWEIEENGKTMIYEIPTRRHIFARFRGAKGSTKAVVITTLCLAIGAAGAATALHFLTPRVKELTLNEAKEFVKTHYTAEEERTTISTLVEWDYSRNNGGSKKTQGEIWREAQLEGKTVNDISVELLKMEFSDYIFDIAAFEQAVYAKEVNDCLFDEEEVNYTLTEDRLDYYSEEGNAKFTAVGEDLYITITNKDERICVFYTEPFTIAAFGTFDETHHFGKNGLLKEVTYHAYSDNCKATIDNEPLNDKNENFLGKLDIRANLSPSKFAE